MLDGETIHQQARDDANGLSNKIIKKPKDKNKHMLFEYTRRNGTRSPVTDAVTFKVGRLKQARRLGAATIDLSHLIDQSYNYHSPRELRWHLAERFGLTPDAVALRESA